MGEKSLVGGYIFSVWLFVVSLHLTTDVSFSSISQHALHTDMNHDQLKSTITGDLVFYP